MIDNINKSVFKDVLFWPRIKSEGMIFIGFIVVGCFYSYIIDFGSELQRDKLFGGLCFLRKGA